MYSGVYVSLIQGKHLSPTLTSRIYVSSQKHQNTVSAFSLRVVSKTIHNKGKLRLGPPTNRSASYLVQKSLQTQISSGNKTFYQEVRISIQHALDCAGRIVVKFFRRDEAKRTERSARIEVSSGPTTILPTTT